MRDDQGLSDQLLGDNHPQTHIMRANFIWELPKISSTQGFGRALAVVLNDWNLAGIWSAQTGQSYSVGFNYTSGGGNINLTGSPDYAARAVIVGGTGAGCGSNPYQQFTTTSFQGPPTGSVGLDSASGT